MGRNIWSKLPEELRERVFAFLPISEVFKYRLVCKQWNFTLTSQSFKELWTHLSPPNPWFLVYDSAEVVAAYDPASSKWTNIPVYQRCSLDLLQVRLMASAGGLLCFGSRNLQYRTLIICNPLTKSRRVLPEMLQIRYINIVGMVADNSTNSYMILVTGTSETSMDESVTEVYDSRIGKWIHQCNSRKKDLQFWCNVQAIWHKGVFYCLAMPEFSAQNYCRLLTYDIERRDWAHLDVKMPSRNIRYTSLIICGGRMLLAGTIVEGFSIKSICIWELRMDRRQCVRVDVMPREVLRELRLAYFEMLHCQGKNNLICFSTHRGWQSLAYDSSDRSWQPLVYDLSDRSWQFLPENKAKMGRTNQVGMSYDPNLAAEV